MGYEGGDLLLTGVAWPTSGSLPGLCAQAVGGGLGGQAALVSDVTAPTACAHRWLVATRCAIQIDVLPYGIVSGGLKYPLSV